MGGGGGVGGVADRCGGDDSGVWAVAVYGS